MSRRIAIIAAIVAVALLTATLVAEALLRARIDARLDARPAESQLPQLHFAGDSAIIAAITHHVPLTASFTRDQIASRIGDNAPFDVTDVELADGAIGVHTEVGKRGRDVVAWVTLGAADGAIQASVVSIEAGAFQLPANALGDRANFTLKDPLAERCPGSAVDSIHVTRDAVDLAFTATDDTLTCLKNQENS